jgi:hypothetical protein
MEIFANHIRQSDNIKGIQIGKAEIKIIQYADDTTGVLADKESFKHFLDKLQLFHEISGLQINVEKTEAMCLGKEKENITEQFGIKCTKSIKLLGITVSYDKCIEERENFATKLKEMKQTLNLWKMRGLSLVGRILLAKSLGYSKLQYIFSVIDVPAHILKEAESILFSFVWKGNNIGKISRKILVQDYEIGGLKMIHIESMICTQRIMWLKRYINNENNSKWKQIVNCIFEEYGGFDLFIHCNFTEQCIRKVPVFYIKCLESWKTIRKAKSNLIWNNADVRIENKPVFCKKLFDAGLWYINDLYDNRRKIIPFEVWHTRGVTLDCFMIWRGLIQACKMADKTCKVEIDRECTVRNTLTPLLYLPSKMCYNLFRDTVIFAYNNFHVKYTETYGMSDEKWTDIYTLPASLTKNNKLMEFQYKISHGYLALNEKLYKMGIMEDFTCSLCKQNVENIEHLFYNCDIAQNLWKNIFSYFRVKLGNNFNTDIVKEEIIFGFIEENALIKEKLILLGKHYIYMCRGKLYLLPPSLKGFLCYLKSHMLMEKLTYELSGNLLSYEKTWKKLHSVCI